MGDVSSIHNAFTIIVVEHSLSNFFLSESKLQSRFSNDLKFIQIKM